MKTNIMNKMSRGANKVGLKIKKHSPEILAVVGVGSVIAGTVVACKATTKASMIMENAKVEIDTVHKAAEMKNITIYNEETNEEEIVVYTEEDKKKDLTVVYTKTGFRLVKNYAPAAALVGLGLGALLASNNILRKRYIASAAAYAAVDRSFKEYRGRVVERFGKELDRELKYNIKAKEVEETVVDGKGKEKQVKKTIEVVEQTDVSDYAKFFDCGCIGWTKDPEANLIFLKQQQNYANNLLQAKGHVFLNEVYDMLGIPRTKAGQIVGWIYDEDQPIGDNYIDFGIYDTNRPATRDFVNGYERTILLDFNVDGNILDKMWMTGNDSFGSGNI